MPSFERLAPNHCRLVRPSTIALLLTLAALMGCSAPLATTTRKQAMARSGRCAGSQHVGSQRVREVDLLAEVEADAELRDATARMAHAGQLPFPFERTRETAVLVLTRMQLFKTEISAAQAYADCLGDSLEDVERALVSRQSRTESTLTALSIAIGAAGAFAAGTIELTDRDSPASPIVGIAAGAGSAGLGVGAMLVPSPTIHLEHDVNVLASVWSGVGEDGSFSPVVWKLLFLPRNGGPSPAESLRRRWRDMLSDADGSRQPELERLLFGRGGRYDLSAIRLREVMLDHLETEVDLMNHELQALIQAWTGVLLEGEPNGSPREED